MGNGQGDLQNQTPHSNSIALKIFSKFSKFSVREYINCALPWSQGARRAKQSRLCFSRKPPRAFWAFLGPTAFGSFGMLWKWYKNACWLICKSLKKPLLFFFLKKKNTQLRERFFSGGKTKYRLLKFENTHQSFKTAISTCNGELLGNSSVCVKKS